MAHVQLVRPFVRVHLVRPLAAPVTLLLAVAMVLWCMVVVVVIGHGVELFSPLSSRVRPPASVATAEV